MADFWVKVGDDSPPITATLKDGNGNAVDLADADVRFIMRAIRGADAVIAEDAANDQVGDGSDGSLGKVHYDWVEGETDVAGGFYGEFEVTFSGGEIETFPNNGYITIAVVDDLGEVVS